MKVLIGGLLCLGVVLVLGSAVLFRPKTVDLEPFNLTYSELKEMGITKRREVESNHSRGYVISIVDINSGKSSPEEAYEIEFSKYKISRVILVGGVIIVDAEYAKSDSLSFVYLVPHKTFGEYKGLRLYLNGVEVGGTQTVRDERREIVASTLSDHSYVKDIKDIRRLIKHAQRLPLWFSCQLKK